MIEIIAIIIEPVRILSIIDDLIWLKTLKLRPRTVTLMSETYDEVDFDESSTNDYTHLSNGAEVDLGLGSREVEAVT